MEYVEFISQNEQAKLASGSLCSQDNWVTSSFCVTLGKLINLSLNVIICKIGIKKSTYNIWVDIRIKWANIYIDWYMVSTPVSINFYYTSVNHCDCTSFLMNPPQVDPSESSRIMELQRREKFYRLLIRYDGV